jgi:hypothetical protein
MALSTLSKANTAVTGHKTVGFMGSTISKHTMTFSEDVIQMIVQQLTDLYSDPIAATVRETISNAIDATLLARERGEDAPDVDVSTPSAFSPTFTVEDHGVGMTSDQIYSNFADYGNSTKIDDMTATGSKGLGAKAPLAYTTTCVVSTVKDGHKIILTLNRGENSNEAETIFDGDVDEHNGTKIEIPVRAEDADKFQECINKYKMNADASIPLRIDGEPAYKQFNEIWSKLIDFPIAKDAEGKDIYGTLYVKKSYIRQAFKEWRDLVRAASNHDWSTEDRNNIAEITSVSLMGWNYEMRAGQYYYTKNEFLVRIAPGVVDFPPSRDSIKRNDRLDSLLDAIRDGMKIRPYAPDEFTEEFPAAVAEIWGSISPDERIEVLDQIADMDFKMDTTALMKVWPDEVKLYTDDYDGKYFRAILGFNIPYSTTFPMISSSFIFRNNSMADKTESPLSTFSIHGTSVRNINMLLNNSADDEINDDKTSEARADEINGLFRDDDVLEDCSKLISVRIGWMKKHVSLFASDYASNSCLTIIKGKFEGSKSYRRLRRYIKSDQINHSSRQICCIVDGDVDAHDFDDMKKSAEANHVEWGGVIDWDDVTVKSKTVKTPGKKQAENVPVSGYLDAAVGSPLRQRFAVLLNRNGSYPDFNDTLDLQDLRDNDGTVWIYSRSWGNRDACILLTEMVKNRAVVDGKPFALINASDHDHGLRAAAFNVLSGYDKIWIVDGTPKIPRYKAMKDAHIIKYGSDPGLAMSQAILSDADHWSDLVYEFLCSTDLLTEKSSLEARLINLAEQITGTVKHAKSFDAKMYKGVLDVMLEASKPYQFKQIVAPLLKNPPKNAKVMEAARELAYHSELKSKIQDDQSNLDVVMVKSMVTTNWGWGSYDILKDLPKFDPSTSMIAQSIKEWWTGYATPIYKHAVANCGF